MTVFRRSVSWSKFSLALSCPLKLQKTIEKEFSPKYGATTKAAAMGKLVQKVFELYFNQDLNLKPGGLEPKVLPRVLDKVLNSPMAEKEEWKAEYREEALEQVIYGMELFRKENLLGYRVRSEVKMQVVFNGFRMFGMLDFLVGLPAGKLLYDGKGNSQENADPNQLLYYALTLHAAGEKLLGGGFLYWKHGFRNVDISPKALYEFIHGDFARGRKIFEKLKVGVEKLEAVPTPKNCNFCLWKATCEQSVYKKEPGIVYNGVQEVGF